MMLQRLCLLRRCTRAHSVMATSALPYTMSRRMCSNSSSSSDSATTATDATSTRAAAAEATTTTPAATPQTTATAAAVGGVPRQATINSVTLVGVVHDVQTGYVFEDAVTQFTLTTTSLDTTNPLQECVIEKDHHTIRCYGDVFAQQIKATIKDGNVVCVNGRLRLNPQLEASCGKYYYYPYIHVQPPHGQVAVVYGDHRTPPTLANGNSSSGSGGGNGKTDAAAGGDADRTAS